MSSTNCKVCTSPHRQWVDTELRKGTPASVVKRELNARGGNFNDQNLSVHKRAHVAREVDELLERTRQELRQRAELEPPTRRTLLLIMEKALKDLPHTATRVEHIVKAIELLEKLEGEDTDRAFLAAYMERAFAPVSQAPATPIGATTVRQLEAS